MNRSYTLVQITDPHLHAGSEGTLLGMNTEASLSLVVDLVKEEVQDIDLILATGDIAQDSSLGAYEKFKRMIAPLNAPARWIPGNHDDRANQAAAAQGTELNEHCCVLGNWAVILLDTLVPGQVHGRLAEDQLALLESLLIEHADKHVLVTYHHNTFPLGSKWLDQHSLKNPDDVCAVLNRHSNVKLVLCGHVHQESDITSDNIRFISTPSTCVQFAPKSTEFGIDNIAPGYRVIQIYENGSFDTRVSRTSGQVEFEIDYDQKGY